VSDIVTVSDDAMQPPPNIGETEATNLLEGVATVGDSKVMVLNLSALACSVTSLDLPKAA
jgi:purine-binding chemotaxis protein CheW